MFDGNIRDKPEDKKMNRDEMWSHAVRGGNETVPVSPFPRVRDLLGAGALREFARNKAAGNRHPAAPGDFPAPADGAPGSEIDLRRVQGDFLLRLAGNRNHLSLPDMLPLNRTSETRDLLRPYYAAAEKQTDDGVV